MTKQDELKKWLRENSSGVYRNAALAADVIEDLENRVENYEELVSQLEHAIVFPKGIVTEGDVLNKVKEILGLTNKVIFERRIASQGVGT